jgi:predicted GIY-YIG superfamily endonuclease
MIHGAGKMQKTLSQIEPRRRRGNESHEFKKDASDEEEKFKQASIAYLERLINERKKINPK